METLKFLMTSTFYSPYHLRGDSGYCFKAGNEKDLEGKSRELIFHKNLVSDIQFKAQRRINENYNWDKITDRLEEIYEKVLKG